MSESHGREAILRAFDRLFDRAIGRLQVSCTPEEKADARHSFLERYGQVLELLDHAQFPAIDEPVMERMEQAIDDLSPAAIAGHLATGPLALHVQDQMRALAVRAAEQRVLEHLASKADDSYGGN